MRAIQSSDDHGCFTVIDSAVTLHASTYLLDYFRWFWLHKGAYTFQAKQCSHQTDQNDEDCTELDFGQFSSAARDVEHRITLDDLVSALEHELHAAEVPECRPPPFDV